MSLRDLTKEKHKQAESTEFMKAVFNKSLPKKLWIDWTFQKILFYEVLESNAEKLGLLHNIKGIKRLPFLQKDLNQMHKDSNIIYAKISTLQYINYLNSLAEKNDKILSHLYTWHLGDMYGGQIIKKLIDEAHFALNFDNAAELMKNLRCMLYDGLADEANIAFDWAIKMMREYDRDLE
jgi:heme oxygenase